MKKSEILKKALKLCQKHNRLLTQSELSSKLKISTTKLRSLFGTAKTTESLLKQYLYCDKSNKVTSKTFKKSIDTNKFDNEIEEDIAKELVRLGTENKMLRKEVNAFKSHNILEDAVLNIVRDAVSAVPPIKIKPSKIGNLKVKDNVKELLLLWSDFHGCQTINAEEMNFLNEYSSKIMMQRFQYMIDYVIKKHERYQNVETLHVAMLGDMISGIIHEELEITNDMDIVSGVFAVASMISQGILELATHFKNVNVFGVPGNHGRIQKQVRFKKKYVNWDWVIYKTIELTLRRQKNITCDFPKSIFMIKSILGENHLFLHGDNIRGWNGIPFYGINRTKSQLADVLASKKITFRNIYLGHFHNTGQLDKAVGEVIINGSMSGGDEYALGKLFTMSAAKQLLMCVEKDKGTTWRDPIILDDASKVISDEDLRYRQYEI